MNTPFDATLDELHRFDPEFGRGRSDGMSNHGPMAAEALVALGRADAVPAFVDRYVSRLRPLPEGRVLSEPRAHLGDPSRVADHVATFTARLAHGDPREVLREAMGWLAPGALAGALHALIRTGHAVRALTEADTPARRRELAHALGYWTARHQTLPGVPGASPRGLDVVEALAAVPLLPRAHRGRGLIFQRAALVDGLDGFAEAVAAVDLDTLPFEDAVTALVDAAAHLYLTSPTGRFVYLHTITSTSLLRVLGAWLDETGRRALLAGTWHALAALHATHADPGSAVEGPAGAPPMLSDATLADLAAASGDDHTIKLLEALVRERRVAARAVLDAVVAHRVGAARAAA